MPDTIQLTVAQPLVNFLGAQYSVVCSADRCPATWHARPTTSTRPPRSCFYKEGYVSSAITIGTAPDSWGVWFPSDPEQVPPEVFLREVAEAGYEWIELGPYGYLPSDPVELSEQLEAHGLGVLAGTVFEHLHRPDSWDAVWTQVTDVAALTEAVGGKHIVVIPDTWRHHKTGEPVESRELTSEQWKQLATGLDELGRRILGGVRPPRAVPLPCRQPCRISAGNRATSRVDQPRVAQPLL